MIVSPNEIRLLNLDGLRVGVTSGCFDLLHFYHLHYLERCRARCDFLIVGVDSDDLLHHFKKKRPTISEYHRTAMVGALRCVDAAFTLRSLDQFSLAVQSSTMIFKNQAKLYGQPIVGADRAELVVIPDVDELTSTTAIVRHIKRRKPRRT